jgi:hypothetical protein
LRPQTGFTGFDPRLSPNFPGAAIDNWSVRSSTRDNFAFGTPMPDFALVLGPVVFENFEVPPRINFGGAQRLAIHKLAGGGRVIDSIGRDDSDICFRGIFSGANAMARARLLDELRASGVSLPLTWDVLYYTVVIRRFEADYQNGWWIPYRIDCCIVQDEASVLEEVAASLAADLAADVGVAASQVALSGVDISAALSAISVPGATTRDTAAFVGAQAALVSARMAISEAIGSAENNFADIDLDEASSPDAGLAQLATAVKSSGGLAALATANGYLGRAATNLANTSTWEMKTITVAGGNLFQIASRELNDATQWIRIAQLNGISDPILTGIVTLLIPNVDPNAGGGIADQ